MVLLSESNFPFIFIALFMNEFNKKNTIKTYYNNVPYNMRYVADLIALSP